jgi:hypothetical protein
MCGKYLINVCALLPLVREKRTSECEVAPTKKGYYSSLECSSGANKTGTEKMRVSNLVHWIK